MRARNLRGGIEFLGKSVMSILGPMKKLILTSSREINMENYDNVALVEFNEIIEIAAKEINERVDMQPYVAAWEQEFSLDYSKDQKSNR